MRLDWSPLALERVEEIARYIAEDNPAAAERWVTELFDVVERLAEFPESGRAVPELRLRRIREVIFGAYRVIYTPRQWKSVTHGTRINAPDCVATACFISIKPRSRALPGTPIHAP